MKTLQNQYWRKEAVFNLWVNGGTKSPEIWSKELPTQMVWTNRKKATVSWVEGCERGEVPVRQRPVQELPCTLWCCPLLWFCMLCRVEGNAYIKNTTQPYTPCLLAQFNPVSSRSLWSLLRSLQHRCLTCLWHHSTCYLSLSLGSKPVIVLWQFLYYGLIFI